MSAGDDLAALTTAQRDLFEQARQSGMSLPDFLETAVGWTVADRTAVAEAVDVDWPVKVAEVAR